MNNVLSHQKKSKNTFEEKKSPSSPKNNNNLILVVLVGLVVVLGLAAGYLLNLNFIEAADEKESITQLSESSGFPVTETPALASEISRYDGKISNIQYKGLNLDKNQCLYLMARSITLIDQGEKINIPIRNYASPANPYGVLSSANVARVNYVDMASRTYIWMDNNGQAPNYTGIYTPGSPDLSSDLTFKLFMKVLTQYNNTGKLPSTVFVS